MLQEEPVRGVAANAEPQGALQTETNSSGWFTMDVGGDVFRLELSPKDPSFAQISIPSCFPGQRLVIQLQASSLLHGVVSLNGGPYAGATLELSKRNEYGRHVCRYTAVDAQGNFAIERLEPEEYVLEIRSPGVESSFESIVVPRGVNLFKVFDLTRAVRVTGSVVSAEAGQPISKAKIGTRWDLRDSAVSDDSGRFSLDLDLVNEPGPRRLYCAAKGYQQVVQTIRGDGSELEDVQFQLPRGTVATGRVVGPTGPLPGARVSAIGVSLDSTQLFNVSDTRTSPAGEFVLDALRPDQRHVLLVEHRRMGSVLREFPEMNPISHSYDVGDVALFPESVVRGAILSSQGSGLEGYEISSYPVVENESVAFEQAASWFARSRRAWSTADGEFFIGQLAEGHYQIFAQLLASGGETWRESTPVYLPIGPAEVRLSFVVTGDSSIGGVVVSPIGEPVSGAILSLRRSGTSPNNVASLMDVRTDHDGRFLFFDVDPGEYKIVVRFDSKRSTVAERLGSAGETFDGIFSGQLDRRLVLPSAESVSGFVVDANHAPIPNYWVLATTPEMSIVDHSVTDSNGAFNLNVGSTVDIMVVPGKPGPRESSELVVDSAAGPAIVEPLVIPGTSNLLLVLPYVVDDSSSSGPLEAPSDR